MDPDFFADPAPDIINPDPKHWIFYQYIGITYFITVILLK